MLALFSFSSVLFSSQSITQRPVSPGVAQSIVPGVILGYGLPTIAALLPTKHVEIRRYVGGIWRASPLICLAVTRGLAAALVRPSRHTTTEAEKSRNEEKPIDYASDSELQPYTNKDVAPLKLAHFSAFAACVAVPIASKLASGACDYVFQNWAESSLAQVLPFAQHTGVISAASSLVYSLYSAWELRSLGFVRTQDAVFGGLASLAILSLAGPGAVIAGVSYWREHVIASLSFGES